MEQYLSLRLPNKNELFKLTCPLKNDGDMLIVVGVNLGKYTMSHGSFMGKPRSSRMLHKAKPFTMFLMFIHQAKPFTMFLMFIHQAKPFTMFLMFTIHLLNV